MARTSTGLCRKRWRLNQHSLAHWHAARLICATAQMTVAVCITTRNRRVELERTLAQLARLVPAPDEIFIVADGCTDGTAALVRAACPQARLIEHATGAGSVASRDEMARATACDIFLSLDDDSYPNELDAIARLRVLFENKEHWFGASAEVDAFRQAEQKRLGRELVVEDESPTRAAGNGHGEGPVSVAFYVQELHEVRGINRGLEKLKAFGLGASDLLPSPRIAGRSSAGSRLRACAARVSSSRSP